jgi:phosphatidylinositol alpha-1,6-mannosyltransferase
VAPRVLCVSKPIAPPFHDGTKCLVRDIALNLKRVTPRVMSTPNAPPLERSLPAGAEPAGLRPVELLPVYRDSGRFAPALSQNVRGGLLLLGPKLADVWHFVFAPNPSTSRFGAWLRRIRRVPTVQTIASPPRSFDAIESLLFGDVVVAQSTWTRRQIEARLGSRAPRLSVIPPPVPSLKAPTPAEQLAVRRTLGVSEDALLFVFPGDLEVSRGAERVADLVDPLVRELPNAVVVFAYREKTPRAAEIAELYQSRLSRTHTRFVSQIDSILGLVAMSTAVLFPVDDLWGKVDLPIVLLEAMVLGVPVVAVDRGPLADLPEAVLVPDGDAGALLKAAISLGRDADFSRTVAERQRRAVRERHAAHVVAAAYEELYLELAAR